MNILAADDERLALHVLVDAIQEAMPQAQVHSFQKASELLEFAKQTTCQVAFLDIQMRGMNGITLAKKLKDVTPDINIIFVTGYAEYAVEAIGLRTSGYLLKPVTANAILAEIEHLRYPPVHVAQKKLTVRTFANFEVYVNEKPVSFLRNKSKELFAYLIDRKGTSATYAELACILWDDGFYDRSRQKQLYNYISDMVKSLEAVNMKDVVIKDRTGILVDTTKIDCDMYRFLEGDITAINEYHGEYMSAYSWAEFSNGNFAFMEE